MKIETQARHEGNTAVKRVVFSNDSSVASKIASLLTKSQYTKNYSPVRELWLNARENEQLTIEKTGSAPRKTELVIPNSFVLDNYRLITSNNNGDGTIVTSNKSTFNWGEQTYHVDDDNESRFSIRNYGLSMTADEAIERIGMIGSSSKSDSDNFGGGMGIGSLSPLYLADRVLFENFHDGEVTYIAFFRDEGGVISYEEPYSAATDEEDGMRVSFDVVDRREMNKDLSETLFLAGKSERVEVTAPETFVATMRQLDKAYKWFNADGSLRPGWNALYVDAAKTSGIGAIQSDTILIDGCRYSMDRQMRLEMKSVPGNVFAFYNAPVGQLEPSTSREQVSAPKNICKEVARQIEDDLPKIDDLRIVRPFQTPENIVSSTQTYIDTLRSMSDNDEMLRIASDNFLHYIALGVWSRGDGEPLPSPFTIDMFGKSYMIATDRDNGVYFSEINSDKISAFTVNGPSKISRREVIFALRAMDDKTLSSIIADGTVRDAVRSAANVADHKGVSIGSMIGCEFPTSTVEIDSTDDLIVDNDPSCIADWSDVSSALTAVRRHCVKNNIISGNVSRSAKNVDGPEMEWLVDGSGNVVRATTTSVCENYLDSEASSEESRVLLIDFDPGQFMSSFSCLPFIGDYLFEFYGYRAVGSVTSASHSLERAAQRIAKSDFEVYVLDSISDVIGDENDYRDYVIERLNEIDPYDEGFRNHYGMRLEFIADFDVRNDIQSAIDRQIKEHRRACDVESTALTLRNAVNRMHELAGEGGFTGKLAERVKSILGIDEDSDVLDAPLLKEIDH